MPCYHDTPFESGNSRRKSKNIGVPPQSTEVSARKVNLNINERGAVFKLRTEGPESLRPCDHVIICDNPRGFLIFILSVRRSLLKENRAKMLQMRLASLGLAAFLCTTAYGQCKVEKGEFYLLGADPVTLYYDAELRDVAKSKAIENFGEKSTDDSDYYFLDPTVCGEGKGRVVRWPLPNSHLSVYFPFSKLGVTLGLYARRRAEEDLRSKEREKRSESYALLRRDEQKTLNDDIRRLKRVLGRH